MSKSLLVLAKTKALFNEALTLNQIAEDQVVFIQDTKEIWTHGTFFQGSEISSGSIPDFILDQIETLKNNKVDKIEGKGLSSVDYTVEDKRKLDSLNQSQTITVIGDNLIIS